MSFTRSWDESTPIDHTKNKEWPQYGRYVKVDVSDRIKTILSGFTAGETAVGIKLGRFLTTGTAAPSAPSGTGTAADVDLYVRQTTAGTYADFYIRNTTGNEIRLTLLDKLCLNNAALEYNNWIIAIDTGGGAHNLIRANTAGGFECGSHFLAPNTAPTTDLQLAPKGYVDAQTDTKAAKEAVNSRTAQLAADTAVGTDDTSTTGDLKDMSVTLTTKGTKLLCNFSAPFYCAGSSPNSGTFSIVIDTVTKITNKIAYTEHNGWIIPGSITWLETGLTPGSHTVKIIWTAGGLQQRGSTDGARSLTVIDLD